MLCLVTCCVRRYRADAFLCTVRSGRKRKRKRLVYSSLSDSECSDEENGDHEEAGAGSAAHKGPAGVEKWETGGEVGGPAPMVHGGSSAGSGRSGGSSCSTGTAAAHAARRLSLASVKQQPELTEGAALLAALHCRSSDARTLIPFLRVYSHPTHAAGCERGSWAVMSSEAARGTCFRHSCIVRCSH